MTKVGQPPHVADIPLTYGKGERYQDDNSVDNIGADGDSARDAGDYDATHGDYAGNDFGSDLGDDFDGF
ncbi:MAG: hypothetical protein ABI670_15225 [Chloroflexota bacterium]